jgi:hypothetical protein
MATWLVAILTFLGSTVGGALTMAMRKPFADEITIQIDKIPERLFFVALRAFPMEERERRFDEWAEDYQELCDAYEKRALVRNVKCIRFSLSLVLRARFIRRTIGLLPRRIERLLVDIPIAAAVLVMLGPLLIVAAIGIIIGDRDGPIMARQSRIGRDGKVFTLYKFRTLEPLGVDGRRHRRSRFTRFIRRASIDELPQLWNVLRGNMSMFGGVAPPRSFYVDGLPTELDKPERVGLFRFGAFRILRARIAARIRRMLSVRRREDR